MWNRIPFVCGQCLLCRVAESGHMRHDLHGCHVLYRCVSDIRGMSCILLSRRRASGSDWEASTYNLKAGNQVANYGDFGLEMMV